MSKKSQRQAATPGPAQGDFDTLHLLGLIEFRNGRLDAALRLFDQALAINPRSAIALVNRGHALGELARYGESLASYDAALQVDQGIADAWYGRGVALQAMARHGDALASYDRAIAIDPGHVSARNNRYDCYLSALGDPESTVREGIAAARANLGLDPAFARMRRVPDTLLPYRLMHDLEQCRYLAARGHDFEGMREAHHALETLHARHCESKDGDENRPIVLSPPQAAAVAIFRDALYLCPDPAPIASCLNPDKDWREIEERYLAKTPEIIHIDGFLSPPALAALRDFCLVSTVWKREYGENKYLGAFANGGFVSRVHLQIARELKARMPRVFGPHDLEQLWAFKYDSRIGKGINVHADFARVNLNFWITPDEANLDAENGGLLVYDAPAPKSWGIEEYNCDAKTMYAFLEGQKARWVRVPYRCNRAVLFNSSLFHETDQIHFAEGYEQRRINVTYLFGRGLKV